MISWTYSKNTLKILLYIDSIYLSNPKYTASFLLLCHDNSMAFQPSFVHADHLVPFVFRGLSSISSSFSVFQASLRHASSSSEEEHTKQEHLVSSSQAYPPSPQPLLGDGQSVQHVVVGLSNHLNISSFMCFIVFSNHGPGLRLGGG